VRWFQFSEGGQAWLPSSSPQRVDLSSATAFRWQHSYQNGNATGTAESFCVHGGYSGSNFTPRPKENCMVEADPLADGFASDWSAANIDALPCDFTDLLQINTGAGVVTELPDFIPASRPGTPWRPPALVWRGRRGRPSFSPNLIVSSIARFCEGSITAMGPSHL
jgi:hypothetical protein